MNVEPFSLSLSAPLETAAGQITARDGFLVSCQYRGHTGVGEATPLSGWTESHGACQDGLERAVDAYHTAEPSRALTQLDADEVPAARHGVATALLDAQAKDEAVALARWFDADCDRNSVLVNATVGDADPDATASAVASAVEAGFGCCKLKVGARSVGADRDRIAAVRETVGDRVTLRLDANGAWDRATAERALDSFEPFDIACVEQPLPADDLAGLAELRGGSIPVAVDETLASQSLDAVLDAEAADIVVLKPMVLGGPDVTYALAMEARAAAIEPVVTTTIDGAVARTAAAHVAAAIPTVSACGLATGSLLAADLCPDPIPVTDGTVTLPDGNGLGLDPAVIDP